MGTSQLFKDPDKELIRLRSVGDRAFWDALRLLVLGMMEWGFTKRQIHEAVTSVKKEKSG